MQRTASAFLLKHGMIELAKRNDTTPETAFYKT